jgi:CDGSH-type Zn-finger protein/uncharacterized Fe-S cluster protein YjdI
VSDKIREYEGKNITIKFHAKRCIHAEECVHGMPGVFEKDRRPWIDPDAGDAEKAAEVVLRCPTGALKFERKDGGSEEPTPTENTVRLEANGPAYAKGDLQIVDSEGTLTLSDTRIALCRCGASENKPFCDGKHEDAGFRASGDLPEDRPDNQPLVSGEGLAVSPFANGPLLLKGSVTVRSADGADEVTRVQVALCRCGASNKKPFCDGTHKEIGFTTE